MSAVSPAPHSPYRFKAAVAALGAYILLVLAASWPLPLHLAGALPADPSGDTGVYVWNLWTFRHELVDKGSSPLYTTSILRPGPPIDLAIHNYTIFQDALALPLIPRIGIIAAFNVTWLLMQALGGLGVYLLALRVTPRHGVAWLAGALFACSPTIIARTLGHQSLVAAAPMAFFLLFVLRAADRGSIADAAIAGAMAAWAAMCDAYFGIYCFVVFGLVMIIRAFRLRPRDEPAAMSDAVARFLNGMMLIPLSVMAFVLWTGGARLFLFGLSIPLFSLWNPVFVLTVLVAARIAVAIRRRHRVTFTAADRVALAQVAVGFAICAALLSPLLFAARARVVSGGRLQERVMWRSSPPGVDLLWFFVPNPNHPLAPDAVRQFVITRPDSFPENVASIPYVALAVIALALWRTSTRPRVSLILALVLGLLALGPFLVIAHANTHVPMPWAFLRYLPIVGAARSPTRFVIPMLMIVSVVFAWALDKIATRRSTMAVVASLLAFELLPIPRPIVPVHVPEVYSRIAADPADVSVLEIPFGVRDGTRSIGRFNTAVLLYQTEHQKALVNGYLSRLPRRVYERIRDDPFLGPLAVLSEGGVLDDDALAVAAAAWPAFARSANVKYVVLDTSTASQTLRRFVLTLALDRVDSDGAFELYRTVGDASSLASPPR